MKLPRHELVTVTGLALAATIALRGVFFLVAPWLWSLARAYSPADITPWVRTAMINRDGAEPYALFALVGLIWLVLILSMAWFRRALPSRSRPMVVVLVGSAAGLCVLAPPVPPMLAVAPDPWSVILVVAACLSAAILLRLGLKAQMRLPTLVAVVLLPMCLIPTTLPSLQDASCILAPALRISTGARLRDIYMQYDLLPQLLALAWKKVGGAPLTFSYVGAATFYALFLGVFWLARRLFVHTTLAAPLLICLVVVRFYAVMLDGAATPQVTPMRLDLWLPLLAVAFVAGLRHWLVGLVLGAMCFFARSIGTLYLVAYVIALGADVLAEQRSSGLASRRALLRAVVVAARETAPTWGFVALAFLMARVVFGSFGSDAVALYRSYGVHMMRVSPDSFYWWLLPMTGIVGWLAFESRAAGSQRRGQAALFAVALTAVSSIYFFGRSHEHNLINLSASFLFCTFLGIDLAAKIPAADTTLVRVVLRAAPWVLVGVCAFAYSARVSDKIEMQVAVVADQRPLPPGIPSDFQSTPACGELMAAAGDGRVFFFSRNDYWLYEACALEPQGYVQPVWLSILQRPLIAEMNRLLDEGYKIAVPRQAGDWAGMFAEYVPALDNPLRVETPHYFIYRRAGAK
jgi:hypothetical protein